MGRAKNSIPESGVGSVPVKELRLLADWRDELGLDRLRADLIDGTLVAWWQHWETGEWHQIPRAHWQGKVAGRDALEHALGWGWGIGGGFPFSSQEFHPCALRAARPGPSKRPQLKQPRHGNKRVQKAVIRRVHEKYPGGVPDGTSVSKVQRKVSDKNPDGFRPGWDAVNDALIALGYIVPKE